MDNRDEKHNDSDTRRSRKRFEFRSRIIPGRGERQDEVSVDGSAADGGTSVLRCRALWRVLMLKIFRYYVGVPYGAFSCEKFFALPRDQSETLKERNQSEAFSQRESNASDAFETRSRGKSVTRERILRREKKRGFTCGFADVFFQNFLKSRVSLENWGDNKISLYNKENYY